VIAAYLICASTHSSTTALTDPNSKYKNGTAATGYGLFSVNAASFQEYFLSGANCEGQAKSSIGLIGPFFHERKTSPAQATPDYAGGSPPCKFVNVAGTVKGFEGMKGVTLEAGGTTKKVNAAGAPLWDPDSN
jgi:hypothetical protein